MAGRGPAPQRDHTRKANDRAQTLLLGDGKTRGPALPAKALGVDGAGAPIKWHPATVKWWATWRKSPQALRMLTEPDWSYLLDTARIHHEFWATGRWELAAELRLRAAKFGATPEDRARLGFEIVDGSAAATPDAEKPVGNVSSIDDRRNRALAGATDA